MAIRNLIGLIIIMVGSWQDCLGQTVISAPLLEGLVAGLNSTQAEQSSIQGTMSSVIQIMEQGERKYREAMTKATWMRELASAQRLLHMVENLVCTSKEVNMRMSLAGSSCFYSFKYDMAIIKVQMAADYLGIILSGVSMTVAERTKTFSDATKAFEESQVEMARLGKELNEAANHAEMVKLVKTEVDLMMTYDRSKRKK